MTQALCKAQPSPWNPSISQHTGSEHQQKQYSSQDCRDTVIKVNKHLWRKIIGKLPRAVSSQGNMYLQELCFKGISITHHLLGWEMTNRGQCKWWHLWNKKSHLTDILLLLKHIEEINHEGNKEFRFWNPSLGNPNSIEMRKMDSTHRTHPDCSGHQ